MFQSEAEQFAILILGSIIVYVIIVITLMAVWTREIRAIQSGAQASTSWGLQEVEWARRCLGGTLVLDAIIAAYCLYVLLQH